MVPYLSEIVKELSKLETVATEISRILKAYILPVIGLQRIKLLLGGGNPNYTTRGDEEQAAFDKGDALKKKGDALNAQLKD
ncbi:MAG: hypothetical protein LBP53_07120 [Candidatus Peribacteria bacterium]|jgi:hypothetical protein|nr:hypothetical protein [Candidatus Peribacteria bacterium]